MNKKWFPILWVCLALALAGCQGLTGGAAPAATQPAASAQKSALVISEGRVVPRDSASLYFYSSGRISEVLVKEGDRVKKGDVLARLGDREATTAAVTAAELEKASAQRQADDLKRKASLAGAQAQADMDAAERDLINAQQKLADVDTSDYTTRLDNARDTVNKTKDDLDDAQDEFDKVKDMDKDNTTRKNADKKLTDAQRAYDKAVRTRDLLINDLDAAKAQVELAKARLADAIKTRDDRARGTDPADQTLADARLKNANAQLDAAKANLARLDLVAPYDGTVVRIDVSAGEQIMPNQTAMLFADLSKWVVDTTDLTEKDVVAVRAGQKVTLSVDALPDLKLTGVVESVSNYYVEKSGDIDYVVRISLDNPDPALRWGMTVSATFAQK